jgi:hypothetical protein
MNEAATFSLSLLFIKKTLKTRNRVETVIAQDVPNMAFP